MSKLTDFKTRFPNFSTSDADTFVPLLEPSLDCYYNGNYDSSACDKEITLNVLAHLIILETQSEDDARRNVTSQSVGSVSVSYNVKASQSFLNDFLSSTKYGQRALNLMTRNIGAHFV